ncbi:3-isopropylmalate dehydratase, large subunit [Caulobacter sp. AP07]|uniref:3-isopropylmalate dehydratase large subunit n=1 Tax=Caulobacter sp. AP07 TaxID=1144304 RepID=UPI0002720725|nr:3-isopropylmalate dehydratase large subunit [Caulobacter sp. AP07]EJL27304.1 3-isopropylmalate dehydratase, large subunit [Caulobacter sp. AP07]
MSARAPRTLFEKVWRNHQVRRASADAPAILYIDLHLVNEVTSPQAFSEIAERGLAVRRPDLTLATIDHAIPTLPPGLDGLRPFVSRAARDQVDRLQANAARHGIAFLGWDDPRRGIVHVIGPELGATQPGMTIVCGDSHTSTHGAFGALAFGIGTSEAAGVLASQCLPQRPPRQLLVDVQGVLPRHVTAKDLTLAIVGRLGASGGSGFAIEYGGQAIRALSMEERMTVCNMTIETGAKTGMIAPDETTLDYLRGRPLAPSASEWAEKSRRWLELRSDDDAVFDHRVTLDARGLAPMVTWGTTPDTAIAVDAIVPAPASADARRALDYMRLEAGRPIAGQPVDWVFLGSCTNGRLSDLRSAAEVLRRGGHIAPGVRMLVVPGSEQVRREAEAEGLDQLFLQAGAEWRLPGCSMCLGMNGDVTPPGQLVVSTSNRNFVGRQGPGARSILASPATAAACALAGAIADPRDYLERPAP